MSIWHFAAVMEHCPVPAADLVVKVVGSLLLHCYICQMHVELRHIKQHVSTGCQPVVQQEEEKKSIKFSTEDALILKSQLGLLWNKLREMRR